MVTRRRTSNSNTLLKLAVVGVVVIALGFTGYFAARAAGLFGHDHQHSERPSREGRIAVPKSLANLNAFEKVTREDVYDRQLGDDSYFWLPKAQVDAHPEWITSIDQVVGRVMARDKRADFVFKESDFLPEGSRTGLIGGVPAGKQGFFLEVEKIPGLRFLKKGDRFDLHASLPEESKNSSAEYGLLMGGIKARGNKPIPLNGVRLLVQGGEMIALTTNRSMTTQGGLELTTTDGRGREIRNQKTERVVIAIDPEEAVPLTQALGDELQIHMVAQSGQQDLVDRATDQLAGMIPVPAAAVEIKAFTRITARDLAEPLNGELRQYYFKPADVRDNWILKVEDLVGKVVARDIEPGYIFGEADFLPEGSLVKDVTAFQVISASDLFAGSSEWIGQHAATDLPAGHKLTSNDVLPSGTLIRSVESFQEITKDDLAGRNRAQWVGRFVARDLEPGHQLKSHDLLTENSLLVDVPAFQMLTSSQLAGSSSSLWVGRVTAKPMEAGQEIDESLLFPVGSKPGISGGIPAGKMAITISQENIQGLSELSAGDRIELIESAQFDLSAALSGIAVSDSVAASFAGRTVNRVLATNALVIHQGDGQIILAVDAGEVADLAKSLASQRSIFAIAKPVLADQQSGSQELDNNNSESSSLLKLESDPDPMQDVVVTKMMVGGKKSAQAFRRSDND